MPVDVCKAIIRASEAGDLARSQDGLVTQANILLQAFAKVGVVALIDEATGFQQVRSPDALRLLVQQYIEEEKREWEKQFSNEYYDELNRLYGSKRLTTTGSGAVIQNRPQHFAKFTRSYVYGPMESGAALEETARDLQKARQGKFKLRQREKNNNNPLTWGGAADYVVYDAAVLGSNRNRKGCWKNVKMCA